MEEDARFYIRQGQFSSIDLSTDIFLAEMLYLLSMLFYWSVSRSNFTSAFADLSFAAIIRIVRLFPSSV